ncbi:Uncharacterized protein TPAR_08941 [Tolypocladium paradoxum]|uniref:DUF7053 domain-containing protein n=1 Tax=Tolypocladium paradoxum TaxID=94208 RepID=A0A2S4KKX8_9HYPO|nr:Uncharacterized protein TPAR_08941 [Tolypocladium paradoxum]
MPWPAWLLGRGTTLPTLVVSGSPAAVLPHETVGLDIRLQPRYFGAESIPTYTQDQCFGIYTSAVLIMSSLFNTTAALQHATSIPAGIAPERGVELLQGHEFFIQCDPHMIKYEAIDTPSDPEPTLPDDRGVKAVAAPKCYQVTDKVHALPAGLWDSDVVSTYEFINIERGVFVRIRSPLNTTMETVWEIRESDDGGSELVEDVVIKCSRLLVGIVKNTCETGWKGIHGKMVGKLEQSPE